MSFYGHSGKKIKKKPKPKPWAYIAYGFCIEVFIRFQKTDTFKVGGGRDLIEHGRKILKTENTR